MKANSSTPTLPRKPRPDFPLFPHATGRWAKKVRGKLHYFGKTADDPTGQAALDLWTLQKDDLLAGRVPRTKAGGLEVRDLCNHFLTAKLRLLKSGEITPRTFDDYRSTTDCIIEAFGARRLVSDLGVTDFDKLRSALAKRLGVVALANAIQRVRSVFRYGFEAELIDRPVRFGPTFKRPSKKSIRLARAEKGPRLFGAEELRTLLDEADGPMEAMILLAVNGGLGNSDIASLPLRALDLEGGWLNFPRPKTGIDRRIPLWPETVETIQGVLARRPEPKDAADAGLLFITKHGHSWGRLGRYEQLDEAPTSDNAPNCESTEDAQATAEAESENKKPKGISPNNSLSKEFRKLAKKADVSRTFYDLRHTFRTIGDEAKDQPAVNSIMGHADESMAAVYRGRISDERLRAVVDHVRAWLYPQKVAEEKAAAEAARAKAEAEAVKAKRRNKRARAQTASEG